MNSGQFGKFLIVYQLLFLLLSEQTKSCFKYYGFEVRIVENLAGSRELRIYGCIEFSSS
jgi:hypothetical protein